MKQERGFTIVELLIVIVVIAILAAITIVAYNGVQNKARDTNNKTDALAIVKVAEAVNADDGAYPTGTDTTELLASFASGDTADLPTDITVTFASAAPAEDAAETASELDPRSYAVEVCAGGLTVYYPSRADNAIQAMDAGGGCQ